MMQNKVPMTSRKAATFFRYSSDPSVKELYSRIKAMQNTQSYRFYEVAKGYLATYPNLDYEKYCKLLADFIYI